MLAIDAGIHARLMRRHPVDIAFQRIDFAVMGDDAKRLGQTPGREGVGRIALMIDGEIGDEALIQKIGIEGGQVLGEKHALIDHRAAGQRADVELADALSRCGLFNAAANDIEIGFELFFRSAAIVGDHDLLDLGTRGIALFADDADIHWHLAPAIDRIAVIQDLALDNDAAALLLGKIGPRQEDLADGEFLVIDLLATLADEILEEGMGNLHMDTGAIAGLAIGIDGTTMPDRFQRLNAFQDDIPARPAIDRDNGADAAGVMFVRRVIQAGRRQLLPRGNPIDWLIGHDLYPCQRGSQCPSRDWLVSTWSCPYSAALTAGLVAARCWWIAAAASRPSRIAQTTSEAPRTISPAAKTPGRLVIIVLWSIRKVPALLTESCGTSNSFGNSSGSKPSALMTRSASILKLELSITRGVWRPLASGRPR